MMIDIHQQQSKPNKNVVITNQALIYQNKLWSYPSLQYRRSDLSRLDLQFNKLLIFDYLISKAITFSEDIFLFGLELYICQMVASLNHTHPKKTRENVLSVWYNCTQKSWTQGKERWQSSNNGNSRIFALTQPDLVFLSYTHYPW